jgi:hypothetical protein
MHRSLAFVAPIALAACASAGEPASSPPPSALDTLRAGGSYGFVLDESDPAARFHVACTSEHPSDAAASGACYEAVRQAGAREGIRFSTDAQGRLVFTSYGVEDGKPAVYIEVALDASLEKEGVVAARLLERPRGLQMQDRPMAPDTVVRFQVVDADTVVQVDAKKGKLVFRRLPENG